MQFGSLVTVLLLSSFAFAFRKYEYTREMLLDFKEMMKQREEMIAKGLDPDATDEFGNAAGASMSNKVIIGERLRAIESRLTEG